MSNFMILFGMVIAIVTAWYNGVTKPQQRRDDKAEAKKNKQTEEQAKREEVSNAMQTDMLKSQQDGNILLVTLTEQMRHQNEMHEFQIRQLSKDLEGQDKRLGKSYAYLDGRLVKVEDLLNVRQDKE